MFKFLLLFFLVVYIISKVGGFILRTLFSGFAGQQRQANQSQGQRGQQLKTSDGNVNIDYNPKNQVQSKDVGSFKGGDYVKYEEVDE